MTTNDNFFFAGCCLSLFTLSFSYYNTAMLRVHDGLKAPGTISRYKKCPIIYKKCNFAANKYNHSTYNGK